MQRKRVSSSELFAVGYDAENSVLEIELLNGSIYQYIGVARMIYEELMSSTAKHRYYARYIKSSFPYEKLQ
ncbi:KTSC domain-containing protein [Brenneria izadpanahii]|uniref:KTSC domain-containing protein n=1 Tax=Brenneria izadpanahii TaxID=2722756 RepID=A0ABX7UTX0_9GAMM|nr:KTSC domain-containing protein [Brenneria izadpanahii]